jgi:ketosteroid isomerase-like protein
VGWEGLEEGLRQQFEVFSETKVTPHHVDIHVSETGNVAWLSQAMKISTRFLGSPMELEARITGVFEKRETGWLMVQFHYSVPMSESIRIGG